MPRRFTICILLLFNALCVFSQAQKVVFCSYLFDSEAGVFKKNQYLLIENDKITGITDAYTVTAQTNFIDLKGYTVLPGLIDAHTHFLHREQFDQASKRLKPDTALLQNEVQRKKYGESTLRSYLNAGFTSIRDLGNSGNFLDIQFRDKTSGNPAYPRLFVSGKGISYENGQFSSNESRLNEQEYLIVHDSNSVRQAIETLIAQKADLVKVYADNAPNPGYMPEPLFQYIVSLAHARKLKVAAHCVYEKSIELSINAGVDCIEHGYAINEKYVQALKDKHIAVVFTFEDKNALHRIVKTAPKNRFLLKIVGPLELKGNRKKVKLAFEKGLFICSGSDNYLAESICVDRGEYAKSSIFSLLESGIPLEKSLQAVTWNTALLIGRPNELGVLKSGAFADMVAVKGDLKQKPALLKHISFIMKGGEVFKR